LTTIGTGVLLTTIQRKGSVSEGLISMCGKKAGTWMNSLALADVACSPLVPQRTLQLPDRT
jgi:hypothetical protein